MIIIAKDQVREPLNFVVPYFNPWRYKTRTKHAERALKHFADIGAVITLVEIGFNRRDLVFADSGLDGTLASCQIAGEHRHKYIGLHTKDELWLKENAINVGVQNLPYSFQQIAWPDADIQFARPNIVGETIHKLQHYSFVQMFGQAQDLGPNYEILKYAGTTGFVKAWQDGMLDQPERVIRKCPCFTGCRCRKNHCTCECKHHPTVGGYPTSPLSQSWPGLAWACTRKAWDAVGGLFDIPVVDGGADHDMARAMIEQADGFSRKSSHPNFKKLLSEWEDRCRWNIRRNIGYVEGTVLHHWHGPKRHRQYNEKYRLSATMAFDPLRHIKRDSQGLYQLHDDGSESYIKFREGIRRLAALRKEDSIEL